jgi:hypothetical protein
MNVALHNQSCRGHLFNKSIRNILLYSFSKFCKAIFLSSGISSKYAWIDLAVVAFFMNCMGKLTKTAIHNLNCGFLIKWKSFLVLNLFQDPETSSGLEDCNSYWVKTIWNKRMFLRFLISIGFVNQFNHVFNVITMHHFNRGACITQGKDIKAELRHITVCKASVSVPVTRGRSQSLERNSFCIAVSKINSLKLFWTSGRMGYYWTFTDFVSFNFLYRSLE